MTNKRVAIWGSYNHGNYGDDVMAIAFARVLKKHGFIPIVYRLNSELAASYGFLSTDSLDELIANSSFCIIGGGAWLCSGNFSEAVEKDCEDFEATLNKYDCPLYSISIGGDGNIDPQKLSKARASLFSSEAFKGGTVRLPEDVDLLKTLGKKVKYHADIVLNMADIFELKAEKKSHDKIRLGLNLNQLQRRTAFLFKVCSKLFPKITLVSLQSHSKGHDLGFEYNDFATSNGVEVLRYHQPEEFILELGKLSQIISFKLHLGVTCLGIGVPFLSVGGGGKTVAFLKSAKLKNTIHNENLSIFEVLAIFFNLASKRTQLNYEELKHLKTDADLHLSYLEALCDEQKLKCSDQLRSI